MSTGLPADPAPGAAGGAGDVTTAAGARLVGTTLLAGLAAAALALALFVWLGTEVAAGGTHALDERLRAELHALASPGLTRLMVAISRLAAPMVVVPLGLVLAAAFAAHGWPRGALLIVATLAGAAVLNYELKLVFGRTRPDPFFDYPLPESPSFPSGHALFAASAFGGLAVLVTRRLRRRLARAAVWAAALVVIALVGLSRVYLGVHYPSDVLAGYAVGLVWVVAVALGDRAARWRRARRGG
jgi:undecaprenyl-diphosphatase